MQQRLAYISDMLAQLHRFIDEERFPATARSFYALREQLGKDKQAFFDSCKSDDA